MKVFEKYSNFIAEMIGTFFLIFLGCGSIMMYQVQPEVIDPIVIPFIFGGTILVFVMGIGHISGAHLNPAVTISLWANKILPLKEVWSYIVAQFWGGTLAILVLNYIWRYTDNDFGMTRMNVNPEVGFLIEFLMALCFMFVFVNVADKHKAMSEKAGLSLGLIICLFHLMASPLTGASGNPMRSLVPAVAQREFEYLWIYIVAPLFGSCIGAFFGSKLKS